MTEPGQTLHEFVLNLLTDQPSLSAFQENPESALAGAGLSDISASDVHEIVPLVMDYAPMQAPDGFGETLSTGSLQHGQAAAIAQLRQVTQAFTGQAGGDFTPADSYADPFSGSDGAATVAAGPADGFLGTGSVSSPLGDALFGGAAGTQGQFSLSGQYSESHTGTDATTAMSGSAGDGFSGGGNVTSPLGDGTVSAASTADGEFTGNAHLSAPALHSEAAGAFSGSLDGGIDAHGEFGSPLGDGDYSLALPGAGDLQAPDLPTPGMGAPMGAPMGEQSTTDGSNTLASALANPAAGGLADPAGALGSLTGNVPAPAGNALQQNPLGDLPAAGHGPALAQNPVPQGNPASGVTDSVQHTVQHVTDHAQVPGSPDAPTVEQHTANPLGQAGSTVHDTVGTVTDQVHSAASGMAPHGQQADPTHALHSATDAASHGVDQAASHSPLGGDDASSTVNHVSDAMEHNAATDAVHDVGANGLDGLHL